MKKTFLFAQALCATLFISCADNFPDNVESISAPPTAQQFTNLRNVAYENIKQEFTINTSDPYVSITTEKGSMIWINTTCLTKNGAPVTGNVDVEYAEFFDRGSMLVNNKPTMGLNSQGDTSLLISGGEIYINLTQDGVQLQTTCGYQIALPAALTGGEDYEMTGFEGTMSATGEVLWEEAPGEFWVGQNEQNEGEYFYNAFIESFGWFNCDKFASFTGPKTGVEVTVPAGYNNSNSNIFVAIEGEPNTLGTLSGEYPIGLECYLIFVTTDAEGNFVYAIKAVTLTADASYTFTEDEFITVTEAELIAAINALP